MVTRIRIAHSPDSDDAFMFYALSEGLLDSAGLEISWIHRDLETLNQAAMAAAYEITALSFHAWARLSKRYRLMPCGASFGDGYGPVVVARQSLDREDLAGREVAIPGELTTAHLVLRLWQPEVETRVVPFEKILELVATGEALAGVVIHEGALTFGDAGLARVVDLGAWWKEETGGPLPLGCNAIRRDLDPALQLRLSRLLRESIDYALDHPKEALGYARRFARGLEEDPDQADRFVGMYVNQWSRSFGEAGRNAVQDLVDRGFESGVLPERVETDFVELP